MGKHIRCFVSAVLLAAGAAVHAGERPVDYDPAIEELKAFIQGEVTRKKIPALSIALVDGEGIIWQAGFGMQDPARGIPATAETVYRPASISKLVTAVAVMQLHEKGVVDIEAPVTTYLPALTFKDRFGSREAITLRHLMAHRAGILRESPVGNYFDASDPGITATVRSIIGTHLVHPVGAVTKYSNLGPTVAGHVIEKVTGVPFAPYMKKHVLEPVGMRSSSFLKEGPLIEKNLATAFMVDFDGRFFPAPYLNLGTIPAGNLYSTVGDLARFMKMLFAGGTAGNARILEAKTVERMVTVQFPDKKDVTHTLKEFAGEADKDLAASDKLSEEVRAIVGKCIDKLD